jgi:aspartyl/glutamyl-tRNA(Asn/Gln) amidotransferase C subunit
MQIDDKLISYLEDLSCLTLSEEERSRLPGDLQPILECMTRICGCELVTDNIPECSNPLTNVNIFRNDEVQSFCDNELDTRELILKNAPVKNEEFIIAPKTVD